MDNLRGDLLKVFLWEKHQINIDSLLYFRKQINSLKMLKNKANTNSRLYKYIADLIFIAEEDYKEKSNYLKNTQNG